MVKRLNVNFLFHARFFSLLYCNLLRFSIVFKFAKTIIIIKTRISLYAKYVRRESTHKSKWLTLPRFISPFQPAILNQLAKCLNHLPDSQFDQLTSNDCKDPESVYRGTFVRSFLIGQGLQPIALLNSCVDAAFNTNRYFKPWLWEAAGAFIFCFVLAHRS